jgi:pyruvate/2-oxoglutarate dehydrogenase complex dihydrolipoamide dehydrogenase (E3) component
MDFDLIIVGAGQAGGPLATAGAQAGKRVALIEREHVGGTCVNDGCTPTKTMVASARVAYLARRAADFGVRTGAVEVDMVRVRARKAEIVASFREGNQQRLEAQENLELIWGEARFTAPKTLAVALSGDGERTLEAETILINVGQRPSVPPLPGLDGVPFLTSTTVMELGAVPEHLLILGGGYIGLEFAQMFRRFGGEVTVIQRAKQLLPREDRDIADAVTDILREDGVTVLLETSAEGVRSKDGVTLSLSGGKTVSGSHLLVATGRTPNSDLLNLQAAGVKTDDRGYIETDDQLETNVSGIYALGDVKGGPAFTHISYDDFRTVKTNLLDGGSKTTRGRSVPYTVFIDPQLGRIGLNENDAREQGKKVRVAKLPMTQVARAIEFGETRGLMKVLVDAETDELLGAAVLGLEGGEIMSLLQVAMMGGLPYTALRDATFAHPTLAESLNNLFATLA